VNLILIALVLIGSDKPSVPPEGKTMVLIGCDWSDNYKSYARLTGDTPAGGVFWYEFNGDTTFFWHNAKENVGPNGVMAIHIGPSDKRAVEEILSGQRDENIRKLGSAFKEWGHPLFVAIGPEFDHKDNRARYTAAQYVDFYRRVHRIWDEMGVTNVAYVWHSCVENLGEGTWAFYPGDKYVDWFGISLYWPAQFRDAHMFASAARSHKKPLIVMESSSINGKTFTFNNWHGPYLRACAALDARVISYNNFRDHPLIAEPFKHSAFDQLPKSIGKQWGQEMKKPRYLHASPGLYRKLGASQGGDGLTVKSDAEIKPNGSLPLKVGNLTGWNAFFQNGNAQAEDEFSITSKGVLSLQASHEGYLRTEKPYQDFVLTFDWRFPRGGKQSGSGSGILLGLGDEDGWLSQGVEVQIASRNCGDLWVYDGIRFDGQTSEGRFGRVPKKMGAEKPIGEWNAYEIRCEGRKISVRLNGKLVNEATSDRPITGRMGLISQGTEVEFRDFGLRLIP
jgi:hypothetical protein